MSKRASVPVSAAKTMFLIGVLAAATPSLAGAEAVTPPPVPSDLQVPAGNAAFLEGHAAGTQNYACAPSGNGVAWTLFTPQATLFDRGGAQLTTHFFSPNPFESGAVVRPTWQHSADTSAVWAKAIASSTDPSFVAPNAIAWVLLQAVGAQGGPTGGNTLATTTFVQRVNTSGGAAPSAGCNKQKDVGNKAFVPYEADYVFYGPISGS